MTERLPHILFDYKWHPVVPKGVERVIDSNTQPRTLWVGETIVKHSSELLRELAQEDCTPVEFHRYRGSWKITGSDRAFTGEAVSDAHVIPVAVWYTKLGSIIRAIDRPERAQLEQIQLILPTLAPF